MVAENVGTRRLIRTTLRGRASNDDEKVRQESERGDTKDNPRNGQVDPPKVTRERATEKQQRGLQHQRQQLHHVVEVPHDHPVQFSLSVLAALDRGPSHVCRIVTVQPLLAEHRQEGREE